MEYEYKGYKFELDEFHNIHVERKNDGEYLDIIYNHYDMDRITFEEKCQSWVIDRIKKNRF